MSKSAKKLWISVLIIAVFFLTGCDFDSSYDCDGGNPYGADFSFYVTDQYPFPDEEPPQAITDKKINQPYSIYIYVINPGDNDMNFEVRNIKIAYHDITRNVTLQGVGSPVILKDDKKKTYIKVDNISYDKEARGKFIVTGEYKKGQQWIGINVLSNDFYYLSGPPVDPPDPDPEEKPPFDKNKKIYEKEYKQE